MTLNDIPLGDGLSLVALILAAFCFGRSVGWHDGWNKARRIFQRSTR